MQAAAVMVFLLLFAVVAPQKLGVKEMTLEASKADEMANMKKLDEDAARADRYSTAGCT